MNQNLLKLAGIFYKIALVENLTLFHGTDGKLLPKILTEGLDPRKSKSPSKSVYLTPNFATAARYGAWNDDYFHSIPTILEIRISGKQNIKKIIQDELDHPNTWYEGEMEDYASEALVDFKDDIENTFGYLPSFIDHADTWEKVFGNNLYKSIINISRQNGDDIRQIKEILFSQFGPGHINNIAEIAEDGTIIAMDDFYLKMHQEKYPKKIPPSAIKYVYLIDVNNLYLKNVETVEQYPNLLAWEAKQYFEHMRNEIQKATGIKNVEKLRKFVEELIEEDEHRIFTSELNEILENISSLQNQDLNWQKIIELFNPVEEAINQNWGNEIQSQRLDYRWIKMTPQEAMQFVINNT